MKTRINNQLIRGGIAVMLLLIILLLFGLVRKSETITKEVVEMENFAGKGKRFTYCDGVMLWNMMNKENLDMTECLGKPLTDFQKKIREKT